MMRLLLGIRRLRGRGGVSDVRMEKMPITQDLVGTESQALKLVEMLVKKLVTESEANKKRPTYANARL